VSWSRTLKVRQILRAQIEAGEEIALLFSDLRGFSAFTASHGDEAAFRLTQMHEGILRARIQEYGIVVKSLGDGVMAAFERPIDAVHAAVGIQQAVRKRNVESPDDPFDIGIGIASGTPVMTDIDFIGHSVNVAQRLSGLAKGGQILATDATLDAAGRDAALRYLSLGQKSLRGIGLEQISEVAWLDEAARVSDQRDRITLILTEQGTVVVEVAKDTKRAVREALEELRRVRASEEGALAAWAQRLSARFAGWAIQRSSAPTEIGREIPLDRVELRVRRGTLRLRTPKGEIELAGVARAASTHFARQVDRLREVG